MSARFETITGRYLRVELLGREHRIYVEENGQGVPLLCLHTAGSDTRQYRAMLNDEEILRHHRVIAFDLPRHGKSSPPAGWHDEEDYALTTDDYVAIILGVMDALELERPIVVGCSIGGRVVLHLAHRHPQRLGGVIGLQSGAHVDPYYDLQWLNRPDVHGGMVCAGIVSGLIGPSAPDSERWETLWHYMQGGPGVFKGDLHFYKKDGDIREQLAQIDTGQCPVYLLTGEYDYSCTPEDTLEAARMIQGSQVTIMPGLGHFPMSENPEAFLDYFRPVLVAAREARSGQNAR
jgi:pimeloyl-ACP methyl ester carboxylesterase